MRFQIFLTALFFTGFIVVFLSFPRFLFAASVTLSSNKSQIGQNDEYSVNVLVNVGSANGTAYYLRGVFYKSGTTQYCGYTYNGTDWYNGPFTTNNGWQHLLPITVQNSSWSGELKAKIDMNDSGCNQSGNYNFKIERFTTSGNGTFDSQNEQAIQITLPTPTPTPTSSPTNTPLPTATPKPTPTPTPKPTFAPTIKPTIAQLVLLSPTIASSLSASVSSEVLAEVLSASNSPTLIDGIKEVKKQNGFVVFFIIGGIFLLSACGILMYHWKKEIFFHENNNE